MLSVRARCVLALALAACRPDSHSTVAPRDATPLQCSAATPCPSLADQLAELCARPGTTVTRGSSGAYTVLFARTDPESIVYTKMSYVFDRAGKLVGRTSFVNEYGRSAEEGFVPKGELTNDRDACTGS